MHPLVVFQIGKRPENLEDHVRQRPFGDGAELSDEVGEGPAVHHFQGKSNAAFPVKSPIERDERRAGSVVQGTNLPNQLRASRFIKHIYHF
jgi:hypothetical protein